MSNDVSLEQQIVGLGLKAPRVTLSQIDALVARLSFHTYIVPGTTSTIATAIDPEGFVVATGLSACVSAANFNETLGRNAAISKAKAAARDELWKLEGYRLAKNLSTAAKSGLIAGLEVYVDEACGDDAFIGDFASGLCVEGGRRCVRLAELGQASAPTPPAHQNGAPS